MFLLVIKILVNKMRSSGRFNETDICTVLYFDNKAKASFVIFPIFFARIFVKIYEYALVIWTVKYARTWVKLY